MERSLIIAYINKAKKLKDKFLELADQLDKVNKDVTIANVFGSSVSIFGGGMAIVGAVLTPFTLGAGAIVGIVGASIAAAGGATSGGASLVRYLNKKSKLDDLNKEWQEFKENYNITEETLVGDAMFFRDAWATTSSATQIAYLGTTILEVAPSVGGGAARVAGNAARVAAIASSPLMIVNALLLPLNVYELVKASVDLHKGEGCEAGIIFRRVANVLQELIDRAEEKLEKLK